MAEEVSDASSVSVTGYRSLLARRHHAEGVVAPDAVKHAELVFNLSRLHGRLAKDFEGLHRRRGWSWAGFRIMNVLWAVGAAELREIARLSGTSRAAISSALNILERDGLVVRVRDRADGRLVRIGLTDRGRAELRDGMREQAERERAWFAALTEENRQLLVDLLGALADQEVPQ